MAEAIFFKQMRGIGPPYAAWKAAVLPLNYICIRCFLRYASYYTHPLYGFQRENRKKSSIFQSNLMSDSEETRTLDPLIKSQLLCHLSYRVIRSNRPKPRNTYIQLAEASTCNRNGGDGWFRTTEPGGSRFTVCRV